MNKLMNLVGYTLIAGFVAYAASAFTVEVKISERAAVACAGDEGTCDSTGNR
jgi:hypothetical protein